MATLNDLVTQKIITRLIKAQDYRIEILSIINADFLEFALDFFARIVEAKLKRELISDDWYKSAFLNSDLPSDELIINSGLNVKSVSNMYNSAKRNVVLEATSEHYEHLRDLIEKLIEQSQEIDVTLNIAFQGEPVELNTAESLVVINTLAVKRAQLRGGLWSTAGKQVEAPLLVTLCELFSVPQQNYSRIKGVTQLNRREVDFYLFGPNREEYQCEVKLMGQGNPESADAVIARDTHVFIADKLSDLNKQQLDNRNVQWVELRSENGYHRFYDVLCELGIPCKDFDGDIDTRLPEIFSQIFDNSTLM
jgi:flavodoxin